MMRRSKTEVGPEPGRPKPRRARAHRRLRVTHHKLPWDLGAPIRIAHITDVHVGWLTPPDLLRSVIEHTRAANPAMVVLTGDYVNHSLRHTARVAEFISALPKPCFATLGNHDHWSGARGVRAALELGGAIVLSNESREVPIADGWLRIVGVDDGRTDRHDLERAFRAMHRREQPLILSHFPAIADHIGAASRGLVLSGHTHAGQIHVPKLTRAVARMVGHPYLAGWYELTDEAALYVSAGVGQSNNGLRTGHVATPELAIFDLVPRAELAKRSTEERVYGGRRSPTAA